LTGYLYDGDCVVAEFDAQGKVRAQYIHGPGLGADVGSLICEQTLGVDGAASERYYSHNWRGDTIGITDESGASLARYRYGAFGDLIAGDGVIANNILFSGKRYDSAVGLYYFGARYYDASSGRFVSRDPMGYIDGPNDYVLAMNNPLLWIDPWGLCRGSIFSNQLPIFAVAGTVATETVKNLHPLAKGAVLAIGIGSFLYNNRDEISQAVSYGYNSAKSWVETFPSLNISLPSYEYVPGQVLSTGPMITPGQSTNITDNVYTFPSHTGSTYIESVPAQQRNASDNYLFSNTGQWHHVISKTIYNALQDHPILNNQYLPRDKRFQTQANNTDAHNGYQTWHRDLDKEIKEWIKDTPEATPSSFENKLRERYNEQDLKDRFPDGF